MRRIVLILAGVGLVSYFALYIYFYSVQDDRFKSIPLTENHVFTYKEAFEEFNFKSNDGGKINSLLFKADSAKGVVCFWKGNGGNLDRWGQIAPLFTKLDYDVMVTDYRQHGKSVGEISIENFYSDAQTVYDFLKTRYPENQIIVIGYSLGTSIASHLGAANNPLITILIEPRKRFRDKYLEAFFFPFPNFNRFPFRTDLDVQKASTPVVIITGTKSGLHADAVQLKQLLDENDKYFEVQGADHGSILRDKELEGIFQSLFNKHQLPTDVDHAVN